MDIITKNNILDIKVLDKRYKIDFVIEDIKYIQEI